MTMIRLTGALIFIVCLCHKLAFAQVYGLDAVPRDDPSPLNLFPISYAEFEGMRQELGQASKRTLSLELGPKLLELRALYLEKRLESVALGTTSNDPAIPTWGSYFDLLATS